MRRMQWQLWKLRRMQCGSWKISIYKEKVKGDRMGNSTGSMFYAFGAFLLIYLVGVSIYQIYLWIKKWRENREEKED